MAKLRKTVSVFLAAVFVLFSVINPVYAKAAAPKTVKPLLKLIEQPKTTYTAGERLYVKVQAPNYSGKVEYRAVIWDSNIKGIREIWAKYPYYYENWKPTGKTIFPITWITKDPGTYRLTVYVRRVGSKAPYESYVETKVFTVKAKDTAQEPVKEQVKQLVLAKDGQVYGPDNAQAKETVKEYIKINGKDIVLKNVKVEGDLFINGDNAKLQNVEVTGTIEVNPGKDGKASLENVSAGKINVLSGAKESIHIKSVKADELNVSSSNPVRIETDGDTQIVKTSADSYVIFDRKNGTFGTITIKKGTQGEPIVEFYGDIKDTVKVETTATIKTGENSKVAKLELAPENKDAVVSLYGTFDQVDINKEAKTVLNPNTVVKTMNSNAKAELVVDKTAKVEALDKKGNEVKVSGEGKSNVKEISIPPVIVVPSNPPVVVTPVVTSISINGDGNILIPKTADITKNYTAVVKDQNGSAMGGETVTWSLQVTVAGVTVNQQTGTLTVTKDALPGSITLVATSKSSNNVKQTKTITLARVALVVTGITNNAVVNYDVTITASSNSLGEITIKDGNTELKKGTGIQKATVTAEGPHKITVSTADAANVVLDFTIDKTAPVVSIGGIPEGQIKNNKDGVVPTINWSNDPNETLNVLLNGKSYDYTNKPAIKQAGHYTLTATVRDAAGNVGTASKSFDILWDMSVPQISISGVENGRIYDKATPVITLFGGDNSGNYTYTAVLTKPDGQKVSYNKGQDILELSAEGKYLLEVNAVNPSYTNVTNYKAVEFTIDKDAPTTVITGIDGDTFNTPVTPVISFDDTVASQIELNDNATVKLTAKDGTEIPSYTVGDTIDADGEYVLEASTKDALGHESVKAVKTFKIDTTAPVITLSGVMDGYTYKDEDVTVTITANEGNLVVKSNDTNLVLDASGKYTFNGVQGNVENYKLEITATDAANNTVNKTVNFTIDRQPVNIVITGINNGQYINYSPNIGFSTFVGTEQKQGTTATIDGADFAAGIYDAAGAHTLTAKFADTESGKEYTKTISFTIDKTLPVISNIQIQKGGVPVNDTAYLKAGDTVKVLANITDANGLQEVNFNIGTASGKVPMVIKNGVYEGTWIVGSGTYENINLTVNAMDMAGNIGQESHSKAINIDNTKPSVSREFSPVNPEGNNGILKAKNMSIILKTGAGETIWYKLDNGNLTNIIATATLAPVDGKHNLTYYAVDQAGNKSDTVVYNFEYDSTAPENVVVTAPQNGQLTNNSTFDITGSVPGEGSKFGSKVVLRNKAGADVAQGTINTDGTFMISGINLVEGLNSFTLIARDYAGNESAIPTGISRTLDSTSPIISVNKVNDNNYTATVVESVNNFTATFNGTVIEGYNITGPVNGKYTIETPSPVAGTNSLIITAADTAGNIGKGSFTTNYIPPATEQSNVSVSSNALMDIPAGAFANSTQMTVKTGTFTGESGYKLLGAPISFSFSEKPVQAVTLKIYVGPGLNGVALFHIDDNGNSNSIKMNEMSDSEFNNIKDNLIEDQGYYNKDTGYVYIKTKNFSDYQTAQDAEAPVINIANSDFDISWQDREEGKMKLVGTIADKDMNAHIQEVIVNGISVDFASGDNTGKNFSIDLDVYLDEGTNEVKISAVDSAKNPSETLTKTFTVDTVKPSLTLKTSKDLTNNQKANIILKVTEMSEIVINGASYGKFNGSNSINVDLSEGENNFTIRAKDALGNEDTKSIKITRDSIAPVIVIEGVNDGESYGSAVTINLSTTEGIIPTATMDGMPFTGGSYDTDGYHTLVIKAVDRANNTATREIHFTIDKSSPAISIKGVTNGEVTKNDKTLEITATNATQLIVSKSVSGGKDDNITVNGEGLVKTITTNTAENSQATYTVVATALNMTNMRVTNAVISFTVDKKAPVVTIVNTPDKAVEDWVTIQGTIDEKADIYVNDVLRIKGQPKGTFTIPNLPLQDNLPSGDNVFKVKAVDSVGLSTTVEKAVKKVNIKGNGIEVVNSTTLKITFNDDTTMEYTVEALRIGENVRTVSYMGKAFTVKISYLVEEYKAAVEAVVKAEASRTQADVDAANVLIAKLPEGKEKTELTNRIKVVQDEINAYNTLKAAVEVKVAAYETLANGDLSTQELVDAAKEAKKAINLAGLKEADRSTFEARIVAADTKVAAAQKQINEYNALKASVEAKVSEYERLANGDLSTQELIDAAKAAKTEISLEGLKPADKTAFENRITAADTKVAAAQKVIDDYKALMAAVEGKVKAYETLANGNLSTQELVDAANAAKAEISLEGLKPADKAAFETRITAADAKVTAAQKVIDDYKALKAAVEEKVKAYEDLANGDLSTQELINAAKEAKKAINLTGLKDPDRTAFGARIAAADAKVEAAQKALNDYEAFKTEVETKVAEYERLANGNLTTQELINAAKAARNAIILNNLKEADKTAFEARIAAADEKVAAAQKVIDDKNAVIEDAAALNVTYNGTDAAINLPKAGAKGSTITWTASPAELVDVTTGVVIKSLVDKTVKLTAVIEKGSSKETRTFSIIIKADANSPINVVIDAKGRDINIIIKTNLTSSDDVTIVLYDKDGNKDYINQKELLNSECIFTTQLDNGEYDGYVSVASLGKVYFSFVVDNEYAVLKAAAEEKVKAYETLANGDLSTQALIDAANAAKAEISLEGLKEADKAVLGARIAAADAKVAAAQKIIDDAKAYAELKASVEAKVKAYETLANGDLSTLEKINAAKAAKTEISLDGLKEEDVVAFQIRIAFADIKIAEAEKALSDSSAYAQLKASVEASVKAYEDLANGDLSTQALINAAKTAKGKISLTGLKSEDAAAFQARIGAADAKVAAAQKLIDDKNAVTADAAALNVTYNGTDAVINLPKVGAKGSTITWTASPVGLIDVTTGGVVKTLEDKAVILTAVIEKGSFKETRTFNITVKADVNNPISVATSFEGRKISVKVRANLTTNGQVTISLFNISSNVDYTGQGELVNGEYTFTTQLDSGEYYGYVNVTSLGKVYINFAVDNDYAELKVIAETKVKTYETLANGDLTTQALIDAANAAKAEAVASLAKLNEADKSVLEVRIAAADAKVAEAQKIVDAYKALVAAADAKVKTYETLASGDLGTQALIDAAKAAKTEAVASLAGLKPEDKAAFEARIAAADLKVAAAQKVIDDKNAVAADAAALNISYNGTDPMISLPVAGTNGSTITWTASPVGLINVTTGEVGRPAADTTVKLTATLTKGSAKTERLIPVVVKADASNPVSVAVTQIGTQVNISVKTNLTFGDAVTITIYDNNGNTAFMDQKTLVNSECIFTTRLDNGEYYGYVNVVSIGKFYFNLVINNEYAELKAAAEAKVAAYETLANGVLNTQALIDAAKAAKEEAVASLTGLNPEDKTAFQARIAAADAKVAEAQRILDEANAYALLKAAAEAKVKAYEDLANGLLNTQALIDAAKAAKSEAVASLAGLKPEDKTVFEARIAAADAKVAAAEQALKPVSVSIAINGNQVSITVTVNAAANNDVAIVLYDASGKMAFIDQVKLTSNSYTFSTVLDNGTYHGAVNVVGAGKVDIESIVIQN